MSAPEPASGRIELDLPVDAEAIMTFSPSPSQSRPPSQVSGGQPSRPAVQSAQSAPVGAELGENAPLLGGAVKKGSKPFYRARPMWIVPFAVLSSIARGMTLAPRVQVYTQLSCNALHQNYNHTISRLDSVLFPSMPNAIAGSRYPVRYDPEYGLPLPILFPDVPNSAGHSLPPVQNPSKACMGDPAVTSSAARLQTAVMVTMGVLSALTTGFWGQFSERHGRTKVMAGASLGLFITDFSFLLAVQPSTSSFHIARHISPHLLLLLAPVLEGLMGGYTTLIATTSSYISDCTSDRSRAPTFSRFSGISYVGLALGPVIGAQILRYGAGHDRAPVVKSLSSTFTAAAAGRGIEGPTDGVPGVGPLFTVALAFTVVNFLLSVFVFPESVHKGRLRAAAKVAAAEGSNGTTSNEALPPKRPALLRRMFGPLAVFAPSKVTGTGGRATRDWSLTFLALGLFCVLLSAGIFQIKYIFAEHVYGWGSEELSYYVTYIVGLRAVNMLVLTPWIISRFKPKPTPSAPGSSSTAVGTTSEAIAFDLRIAQIAVFLDVLSHTLVLAPITTDSFTFCIFTGLSSLAATLVPTAQSLALSLFNRNPRNAETGVGALFGAISAIQAIGQMVLGPLLFGMVYSSTVATFPKAIFAVASAFVTAGFASLLLIRTGPPRAKKAVTNKQKGKGKARAPRVERERGRSRVVKHVGNRNVQPSEAVVFEPSSSGSGPSSASSSGRGQASASA